MRQNKPLKRKSGLQPVDHRVSYHFRMQIKCVQIYSHKLFNCSTLCVERPLLIT